jgi:competence protein ComFB
MKVFFNLDLLNVLEQLVWDKLDNLLETQTEVCSCEKCRADIVALALNRLKPHYVATEKGEAISKALLLDTEQQARITIALLEAKKIVEANPRHEKE